MAVTGPGPRHPNDFQSSQGSTATVVPAGLPAIGPEGPRHPSNFRASQGSTSPTAFAGKVRDTQDSIFVCISSASIGAVRDTQDSILLAASRASVLHSTQDAALLGIGRSSKVRATQDSIFVCLPSVIDHMAITYPLTPPSAPGPRTFKLAGINLVGVTRSPFSGSRQVLQWPGEWWELEVGLPAMTRTMAEQWVAFLCALRGQVGSFLYGDHNAKAPLGVGTGTPKVNGANAFSSNVLLTKGWTHSISGILLPGDYLQIGTGLTQRLYKNLTTANSDSSGNATLDIFPTLRESLTDNTAIVLSNTAGCFSLATNRREWDINYTRTYGIDFKAVEAI